VAALEEAGFILAEGSRWLVPENERERREKMGRLSSTVVAFVRGVGETEVLLKKGLWLGGRWHSVKRYEVVQPIRVKKGWAWVGERLDVIIKSEEDAMRKVNTTVLGLHKALEEVGKKVDGMDPGKGKGSWKEEFEAKREEKEKIVAVKRDGVDFSERREAAKEEFIWFPKVAESLSLSPEVAPIASVTTRGKSKGKWATKEEVLRALGVDGDWMDMK